MNQNNNSNNNTTKPKVQVSFTDGMPPALMVKKPNKNCSNTNSKNKDSGKSKK